MRGVSDERMPMHGSSCSTAAALRRAYDDDVVTDGHLRRHDARRPFASAPNARAADSARRSPPASLPPMILTANCLLAATLFIKSTKALRVALLLSDAARAARFARLSFRDAIRCQIGNYADWWKAAAAASPCNAIKRTCMNFALHILRFSLEDGFQCFILPRHVELAAFAASRRRRSMIRRHFLQSASALQTLPLI